MLPARVVLLLLGSLWFAGCAPRTESTTPLVLVFGGTGAVRFEPSPRRFAFAPGRPVTSDWPSAATPWLVCDLDGNGRIDDGSELFGSNTLLVDGRTAPHGFAALAALDANRDFLVDDADPAFASLRVWRDTNGDRITQPGELSTLAQEGVSSLSLDFRDGERCDDRGNCERQRARFTGVTGGEVVDVTLRVEVPVASR